MLCEGLTAIGHKVTVIAGVPHYPSGRVPEDFRRGRKKMEERNGVKIIRVSLPSINRTRMVQRLFQFLAYQVGASITGRILQIDLLMMYGPALEMWLPYWFLGVRRDVPIIYSVHDIYPDVGVKLGVFKNRAVIRLVDRLEKYCLLHADKIRILSTSFEQSLISKGVPENKINLIYDWVDTEFIRPLPRKNAFSVENGLLDHFVVLFTGNMGFVQALDTVIQAANILSEYEDILFVFVGNGAARNSLIHQVEELKLKNVHFIGWQPANRMPEVYASADVSLVSLGKGTAFDALPSKTFAIMASERPVIACVDRGSDAWNLIERARTGIPVEPESPFDLSEGILTLYNSRDTAREYAENGRCYVVEHHSPQKAAREFHSMMRVLVQGVQ